MSEILSSFLCCRFINHAFYWQNMSPPSDSNAQREPSGALGERIKATFGSFAEFKKQFTDTGTGLFGSGMRCRREMC